ncbi:MAG TPA: hypothetical protein VFG69_20275 [Nannocystaceae bacterium]|nr:hypothetical protein [Nannocystaceae bacterium]
MMTRLPRLAVATFVLTTLGFGGCAVGRDDDGNSLYTGVSASVPASETTERDAGIAHWDVTVVSPGSYVVTATGPDGARVATMTMAWTADRSTIALEEPASGQFVMDASGTVMENTIDDAQLVAFFEADARAELEAQGFRLGPQCMMATQTVVTDCSKALMTNNPMDVLKCVQSIAAAMMACQGMGPMGGGMTGGGMTGGGMTGGGMTGGGMGESGGGYGTGGGYGSGGYDSYGSGGYGTGYDSYGSGGYGSGGYDDGYNDGGYNDGGYDDGGGYYDQRGPQVGAPSPMPSDDLPSMTFGEGAKPSRLRVAPWNLGRKG